MSTYYLIASEDVTLSRRVTTVCLCIPDLVTVPTTSCCHSEGRDGSGERGKRGRAGERKGTWVQLPQGDASVYSTAVTEITWEEEGAEHGSRAHITQLKIALIFKAGLEDAPHPPLFSLPISLCDANTVINNSNFLSRSAVDLNSNILRILEAPGRTFCSWLPKC